MVLALPRKAASISFLYSIASCLAQLALATAPTDYLTLTGSSERHGHIPTANLDPAVVGSSSFGRIFPGGFTRLPTINGVLPGTNYASPLVYTTDSGQTVVFVATQNNNIYSVDGSTGAVLAARHLSTPFDIERDIPQCGDINSNVGVTGTPVIDPTTGTAYFLSKTYVQGNSTGMTNGRYRIHAVDVVTLQERPNFPRDIQGTVAENDPKTRFNGGIQLQRPGLHFYEKTVYAAFGSHCGLFRAIGWLIGFDASSGEVVTAWVTDADPTNQGGAGIWQSGNGVAAVGDKMYVVTGNSFASPLRTPAPGNQIPATLGNAVIELTINRFTRKVTATDYFLPFNYQAMNGGDRDFGAGGFTIFPNTVPGIFNTGKVKRMGAAVGKPGNIFIFDLDNLGGFQQGPENGDVYLQKVRSPNSVFGQVSAFPGNGGYMYFGPAGNPVQAYKWAVDSEGNPSFFFAGQSDRNTFQFSGSPVVTSIDGQDDTGIVWYIDFSGRFIAYRAVPVDGRLVQIWTDTPSGLYPYNKFLRPGFGNGKVYTVSSDGRVFAFGSPNNFPLKAPDSNFGLVILGQPQTRMVNFTVLADAVEVVAVEISNGNFTLGPNAPTFPIRLTKGQSLLIPVTLNPTTTGSFTAQLTVQTSNAARVLSFANLRGRGKSQPPRLLIAPSSLIFENVITNAGAVTSSFQISNQGIDPLVIKGLTVPEGGSPFRILNPPPVDTVIESDASITISVQFRPTEDGTFSSSFIVDSTGGQGAITLTGTSSGPPIMLLESELPDGSWSSNTTVDFGGIFPGQTKVMRVRVVNVGASRLTLTKVKLPQTGAIQGNINDIGEGLQLKPGENVIVPITFTHPSRPPTVLGGQPLQVTGELPLNSDDVEGGVRTFFFFGTARFPPLPSPVNAWVHIDCFEYTGSRPLPSGLTNGQSGVMTPQLCLQNCASAPQRFPVAGLEFAGECWCGTRVPAVGAGSRRCTLACRGNNTVLCGGPGALNVYVNTAVMPLPGATTSTSIVTSTTSLVLTTASTSPVTTTVFTPITTSSTTADPTTSSTILSTTTSSVPISTMTLTTSSSVTTTPPASPIETTTTTTIPASTTSVATPTPSGWTYVGCTVSGGSFNGVEVPRLFSDGLLGIGYTPSTCQTACLNDVRGFTFAGVEYGGECWCGRSIPNRIASLELECSIPCTADASQTCGGGNRMSLFFFTPTPPTTSETLPTTTVSTEVLSSTVETSSPSPPPLFPPRSPSPSLPLPTSRQPRLLKHPRRPLHLGLHYDPRHNRRSIHHNNQHHGHHDTTLGVCWLHGERGSFNGIQVPRLFPAGRLSGTGFTVTTCQTSCLARGSLFAGTEFGGECWCGSNIDTRTPAPESSCSMPCTADRSQICGGSTRLSLYRYVNVPTTTTTTSTPSQTPADTTVPPSPTPAVTTVPTSSSWSYIGCTVNGGSLNGVSVPRLFPGGLLGTRYTPVTCQVACESRGARFAGVEFGGECWCGSDVSRRIEAVEGECNIPCGVDRSVICGGRTRMSLYGKL
ncbi:hypothetical protein BC829DRAFT_490840 [Chytridium lagenaria]|nr:hypothetical protein BC829DRAFT_490840 [Chytridium lagenaria]